MTIGAIARLVVKDRKVFNNPIMHRIPNKMMAEIARMMGATGKDLMNKWDKMHPEGE